MTRDMDLVRNIVLAARESAPLSSMPNVALEVFAYHAQILQEAGMITAALMPDSKALPQKAVILRLTWSGQDFADSIKNEGIWQKAKDNVIKPSASWTFSILLDYLAEQIKSGLPVFNG